jgi:cyclase
MKGISKTAHAGLSPLIPVVLAPPEVMTQAPPGFIPPPLNPSGARLETKELAPGVYGLLSSKPPVDNSGFVVGEHGVLVIDAHINGAMAGLIQTAVRQVTNKPILYVVNTNYHGDHTFGNYAFPQETLIVAQQKTAETMRDFEREKQLLLATVDNDPTVFGDVRLRLPDVVLDEYLELDLGGRVVELHHFGHGNTPGDPVVFVPEARVAWTGNLILGEGTIPFLIEGGAGAYLETMAKFTHTLEVGTIVPGHGLLTSGAVLGRYLPYLSELIESVRKAIRAGQSLEDTIAATPLGQQYTQDAAGSDSPLLSQFVTFRAGVHRWNVWRTYQGMNADAARSRAGALTPFAPGEPGARAA